MAKTQKASTQQHLDIDDIVDDLVIFKTGWVALVMSTTAVNFDLLSEAEQDATIYAYGAFLNSLTFPLEILIRSKKADITAYFQSLEEAAVSQPNPDLKREIQKYQDFLKSIVQQKTVLDKSFYLIINFSPIELGFKGLTKKASTPKSKMQLLADAKNALYPKRDHIFKQMGRLGLTVRQLTTKELIELFYDIYNPAPTGTQRVILDTSSYTVPIVEPAVESPIPAPPLPGTEPAPLPPSPEVLPSQNEPTPRQQTQIPQPITPAASDIDMSQQNLRPAPQNPISNNPTPAPKEEAPQQTPPVNLGKGQMDALTKLQEATAKAAQLVHETTTVTPHQAVSPASGQSNPSTQPDTTTAELPNYPTNQLSSK